MTIVYFFPRHSWCRILAACQNRKIQVKIFWWLRLKRRVPTGTLYTFLLLKCGGKGMSVPFPHICALTFVLIIWNQIVNLTLPPLLPCIHPDILPRNMFWPPGRFCALLAPTRFTTSYIQCWTYSNTIHKTRSIIICC